MMTIFVVLMPWLFIVTMPAFIVFMINFRKNYEVGLIEKKHSLLEERRKQVDGYDKLPAVERKAQEDLWTNEIQKEWIRNSDAIMKEVMSASAKSSFKIAKDIFIKTIAIIAIAIAIIVVINIIKAIF